MARRSAALDRALEALRTPASINTATSTAGIVEPPTGTVLHEYWKYVTKQKVVNYPRATTSQPGSLDIARIVPFGTDDDASNNTLVQYSARAKAVLATYMGTAANHLAATVEAYDRAGFRPAKVTIKIPGTQVTSPVSKITGIEYKTKAGPSYTFPFGQGTTAALNREKEVKAAILTQVYSVSAKATVTFKPEKIL